MKNENNSIKTKWLSRSLALGMAASIAAVTGCRSAGYQKSDAAARSMDVAAAEVQQETQALDAAITSLNDLVSNPATDLRQQFKYYNRAVDRLYDCVARTEKTEKRMQAKSAAYFDAWKNQLSAMNYQVVRDLSENRREAVSNRVSTIHFRYAETREAVLPLLAYFEDIRKALKTDLTVDGLNAIKGVVKNANENARKVQTALTQLSAEFAASGNQMSSLARVNTEERTTKSAPGPTAEATGP